MTSSRAWDSTLRLVPVKFTRDCFRNCQSLHPKCRGCNLHTNCAELMDPILRSRPQISTRLSVVQLLWLSVWQNQSNSAAARCGWILQCCVLLTTNQDARSELIC